MTEAGKGRCMGLIKGVSYCIRSFTLISSYLPPNEWAINGDRWDSTDAFVDGISILEQLKNSYISYHIHPTPPNSVNTRVRISHQNVQDGIRGVHGGGGSSG